MTSSYGLNERHVNVDADADADADAADDGKRTSPKVSSTALGICRRPRCACSNDEKAGRKAVHKSLCSVLMSRTSFTLFCGFYPGVAQSVGQDCFAAEDPSGRLDFNNLDNNNKNNFSKVFSECCVKDAPATTENELTQRLNDKLNNMAENLQFSVENDVTVGTNQEGMADLVLKKKTKKKAQQRQGEKQKVPLGVVMLGLLTESEQKNDVLKKLEKKFWEKMDQATNYLRLLQSETKWKRKKAVLLGVLVATSNCNMGSLAVFACEPKRKEGYRMALLWRAQVESIHDLSAAFGSYLNGVSFLSEQGERWEVNSDIIWKYVGTNCASMVMKNTNEKYVLRFYDNRVQHTTSSRPQFYTNRDNILDQHKHILVDDAVAYKGGETCDESMALLKWNGMRNSNNMGGDVEVIAVPFQERSHECTEIQQAASIANYLKKMHDDGFVHGSGRGRNIAFRKDRKGSDFASFIDFDFGGHNVNGKKPTYPPHYQECLRDGIRYDATAGIAIHPDHDVHVLGYVLGRLHEISDDHKRSSKESKEDTLYRMLTYQGSPRMIFSDVRDARNLTTLLTALGKLASSLPEVTLKADQCYQSCFNSDDETGH